MKKLFTAFLMAAAALPAWACDVRPAKGFLFTPVMFKPAAHALMDLRDLRPAPAMYTAPVMSLLRSNHFVRNTLTGTYAGIPFHHGAVFCRMENYTLRNYNVKFSVHAGGYHE
jgi:hypothetical protein